MVEEGKKICNIWWHTVLTDTLKTETNNFVLNHNLHWKPVACSEQCCRTCMPGRSTSRAV